MQMRIRRKARSFVVVQTSATTQVTIHVRLAWIRTGHPSIACPEAVRRADHKAGMVRGHPRKIPCLTCRSDSVLRPWARQRLPVGPNAQLRPVEGRVMRAVIVARSVIPSRRLPQPLIIDLQGVHVARQTPRHLLLSLISLNPPYPQPPASALLDRLPWSAHSRDHIRGHSLSLKLTSIA